LQYLTSPEHLSNTWLAEQYHQAITALDDALTGTNEAR